MNYEIMRLACLSNAPLNKECSNANDMVQYSEEPQEPELKAS